jgi:hypothetical protein
MEVVVKEQSDVVVVSLNAAGSLLAARGRTAIIESP